MLKVSLHSCMPHEVSPFNVMGRMDIGYEKLAARATYKTLAFTTGIGEHAPTQIADYPRWSGSVWDLVTRVVCLTFNQEEAIVPKQLPHERKPAFIENLTAVIEHWPDGLDTNVATIAVAHVQMNRRKGHYVATFESDAQPDLQSSEFVHTPLGINPWDLLARAYAWTVNEEFVLPPRPVLCTHIPLQEGEQPMVHLDTVPDPARTGLIRWMNKRGQAFSVSTSLAGDCVTESQFVEFLEKAV